MNVGTACTGEIRSSKQDTETKTERGHVMAAGLPPSIQHPISAAGPVVDTRRSPFCPLRPLPLTALQPVDGFWGPRLQTVAQITLRQQYEQCERTGRIDNFRRAAGKKPIEFQGRFYNDSDVYKWLEAASYALALQPAGAPDPELAHLVESVIAEVAAAQAPDGYLNTYFTFERAAQRWTDLDVMHELYCAGHLIQAAVAHHRATGTHSLLDVAIRLADHICATFGPQGRAGTDGHEEIEMALVELYRQTGDRTYLDRADFFLDQRGRGVLRRGAYLQDHLPVREQAEIVGHAVRATYLACGMIDVAMETGEEALAVAVEKLWQSAFTRKAYITGGLGARWEGESFGADYELPNERAYAETCAAIGGFMWNWRMLLRSGEARCADWMETALYNGILSGLSLDGTAYFYQNPLADRGSHRRQEWFTTACCPPNIARTLLSLPGYAISASAEGLWLHLYIQGTLQADLLGRGMVTLRLETRYPWDGGVYITVEAAPQHPCGLLLRVPSWCQGATLEINGHPAGVPAEPGSYAVLHRTWQAGDVVNLELPMPVRRVIAHPRVLADQGRVALARGPLVYCVEGADHPGIDVWDLELPVDAPVRADEAPDLLGGVVVLRGEALAVEHAGWEEQLYAPLEALPPFKRRTVPLLAVPYYAWANRQPGPMQVWLRLGTGR